MCLKLFYVPNRASKYMNQKLIKFQRETTETDRPIITKIFQHLSKLTKLTKFSNI